MQIFLKNSVFLSLQFLKCGHSASCSQTANGQLFIVVLTFLSSWLIVCVCVCVCGWVHPSGWFSSSSPNTTAGVLSHAVNTNYWQELWLNWDIPHRHTKTHTHRSRLFHQNTNMRSHTNTPTHTQQHEYKTDLVSFRGITVFLYVTSS